eukprot:6589607-Alexandrium_andersonii.AAC.1
MLVPCDPDDAATATPLLLLRLCRLLSPLTPVFMSCDSNRQLEAGALVRPRLAAAPNSIQPTATLVRSL